MHQVQCRVPAADDPEVRHEGSSPMPHSAEAFDSFEDLFRLCEVFHHHILPGTEPSPVLRGVQPIHPSHGPRLYTGYPKPIRPTSFAFLSSTSKYRKRLP